MCFVPHFYTAEKAHVTILQKDFNVQSSKAQVGSSLSLAALETQNSRRIKAQEGVKHPNIPSAAKGGTARLHKGSQHSAKQQLTVKPSFPIPWLCEKIPCPLHGALRDRTLQELASLGHCASTTQGVCGSVLV